MRGTLRGTSDNRDPYTWDNLTGWKSYRMLRPGRGMWYDVKRRAPYYWSDFRDGLTYRAFAATVRIYFVNLLPALAFELDMMRRTGGYFGINEALFSSALAALVFSLLSAQPLTVVGITGLISLFNYTIYDIMARHDIDLYPQMMVWVSIWAAITHWIVSFGNLCDYMRYVTDFSSNTFGVYVGIIYVEKGVQELINGFEIGTYAQGYMGIVVALCFTATVYALEFAGTTVLFTPVIRALLADYAYPIATIFWTGFTHIPGPLKATDLPKIPITRAFYPTVDRSWLVPFWHLPVKWVFVALPIGILLTLLFYYDHNVSSITAQAKQFPLKKPAGFHWDFFLLGCTSFIAGIIGIPLPNGLVPQAPVHTDACTEYKDKVKIIHTDDDEGTEIHEKITYPARVVEQRVSHFLMALGLVGTMTGPLLVVLSTMPRALFGGVFFIVGLGSILGSNLTSKLLFLISERRFLPPDHPLLSLPGPHPKLTTFHFFLYQAIAVAATVAISQTLGAIGFPVLIASLIPFRWVVMPKIFSAKELEVLDSLTADNPVVLASLGGKPGGDDGGTDGVGGDEEMGKKEEGSSQSSGLDVANGNGGARIANPNLKTREGRKEAEREGKENTPREWVGDVRR